MRRCASPGCSNKRCRDRGDRRSAAAQAVDLLVALEVLLVGLEVGDAGLVGEVEEELRLGWVDAGEKGRLPGVADRAGRQAGVLARVVGRVQLQLSSGG